MGVYLVSSKWNQTSLNFYGSWGHNIIRQWGVLTTSRYVQQHKIQRSLLALLSFCVDLPQNGWQNHLVRMWLMTLQAWTINKKCVDNLILSFLRVLLMKATKLCCTFASCWGLCLHSYSFPWFEPEKCAEVRYLIHFGLKITIFQVLKHACEGRVRTLFSSGRYSSFLFPRLYSDMSWWYM